MRTRMTVLVLLAACVLALAPAAGAVEHGAFGLGINSSLSLGSAGTVVGTPATTGVLSFRIWVSQNFAIDPQFGMAVVAPEAGDATVGVLVGSRFLYSAVNAAALRFNVGGEFLASFGSAGRQGAAGSQTFATILFGAVIGVEYFFTEHRNLSFDLYLGLPFGITVEPGTVFSMTMGGNVIAGFHYYF
jgi:hypothetical protein